MNNYFLIATLYLSLLLFFSLNALGQSKVNGILIESQSKAVSFANVLLLQAQDSSFVKGTITDESGKYNFENIESGKYIIKAFMIGYQPSFSTTFNITNKNYLVEKMELAPDVKTLDEVTVSALKPLYEQQIDRLVINVQNSITAAGSTALEVLERSPGIALDRQNGSLSMNGKAGLQVMINGKLTRLPVSAIIQMLEGMNAGNIEKIELISNPSAQYDAEGNAGMINIILKKNTDYGMNGSFTATAGYGMFGKTGASFNLNYRTERLNLFGDYSWSFNYNWYELGNNRMVIHQGIPTQTFSSSSSPNFYNSHTPRIGFDFRLNRKTSIGGIISGFYNKQDVDATNTIQIQEGNKLPVLIKQNTLENSLWRHIMGNLNLRHTINEKQELILDLDYLKYHNLTPAAYHIKYNVLETGETEQEEIRIDKTTPIQMGVVKADYIFNITEKTKIETGAKGTFTFLENEVVVDRLFQESWIIDPKFSQKINMTEDILAGYTNFNHQVDDKTALQAGLRWEHTYTNINSPEQNLVLRNYNNLFPSFFLSRKLNEGNNFQISYSRRISRPTYNNLVPFVSFKDPYSFWSGNAELKPTLTDAIQVSYQFQKSYLLSLNASFDTNAMNWLVRLDPETNQQNVYIANVDQTKTYSLNVSLPIDIASWWQMQNNVSAIWQKNITTYEDSHLQLIGYYGRISSTHNLKLPHNFSFELSGSYQSRAIFGIFQQSPRGTLNLGIQKKLEKDRGTFNLSISDVFWTDRFRIKLAYPSVNLDQVFYYIPEPRVIRFTYSRNFGNKNLKTYKRRNTGSEEERRRVGN